MMTRIFRPAACAVGTAIAPLSKMRAVSATNEGTAQPAATRVAPFVRNLRRDIEEVSAATAVLQVLPRPRAWAGGEVGTASVQLMRGQRQDQVEQAANLLVGRRGLGVCNQRVA